MTMAEERSAELARGRIEAWIRVDIDWLREHRRRAASPDPDWVQR